MNKALLVLLAVIAVGLAALAYYGGGVVDAYWQGREDLMDARGRLSLTEANVRQIDAVTRMVERQDRRQGATVAALAAVVVVEPFALLALVLVLRDRRQAAPVVRWLPTTSPRAIEADAWTAGELRRSGASCGRDVAEGRAYYA